MLLSRALGGPSLLCTMLIIVGTGGKIARGLELKVVSYPVADLVRGPASAKATEQNGRKLVTLVSLFVEHDAGIGQVRMQDDHLVVAESPDAHAGIRSFLELLRRAHRTAHDWKGGFIELPKALIRFQEPTERDLAIRRALAQPAKLKFETTPLKKVVQQLSTRYDLPLQLDTLSLNEVGIGDDTPIDFKIENTSVGNALHHLLKYLELTSYRQDEYILITTPLCDSTPFPRIYPVIDLAQFSETPSKTDDRMTAEQLAEVIKVTIRPDTWNDVGGPGSLKTYAPSNSFVIYQSPDEHEEVAAFLAAFRQFASRHARKMGVCVTEPQDCAVDTAATVLRAELRSGRATWKFDEKPLSDVLRQIAQKHSLPLLAKWNWIDAIGLSADSPVTFTATDEPLDQALDGMLGRLGLTWIVDHGAVVAVPREHAEEWLYTRIYPLDDALPVSTNRRQRQGNLRSLVADLKTTVAADSWDDVGGPGSALPITFPPSVLVTQSRRVHRQLEDRLRALRDPD